MIQPPSVESGSAAGTAVRIMIEGEASPRVVTVRGGREVIVGRDAKALVRLAHDAVSRSHLRLFERGGRWFAEDLGSRHGTVVDGTLLAAHRPVPIGGSSTILVRPFALRVDLGVGSSSQFSESAAPLGGAVAPPVAPGAPAPLDGALLEGFDDASSVVQVLDASTLEELNGRRLDLLLEAMQSIYAARDERGVAEAATKALLTGTGFSRAIYLHWGDERDELRTISIRTSGEPEAAATARVSRTLMRAASAGSPVLLEDQAPWREAESIAGSGVAAALCAPILVPPVVVGYLYLDSQRRSARPNADAATFCHLMAKLCGLALANLQRLAAEHRQRELEDQLAAARRAQQRLLPTERGTMHDCSWRLVNRPGLTVAGDIAGVRDHEGHPTFFVGDVQGKGADAAFVMSMVATHLAAGLEQGRPLDDAMRRLGAFVHRHRRDEGDFTSLFVVQVDRQARRLRTIDAGHGLAVLLRGGRAERLHSEGGLLLGISANDEYEVSEHDFEPGDRLILYTDGLTEQCCANGIDRVGQQAIEQCIAGARSADDAVDRLMEMLRGLAGRDDYDDDVTILGIEL